MSKAIIALIIQAETVDLFEKTFIGGLSCMNMRLAFDPIILLPKYSQGQYKENLKAIYKEKKRWEKEHFRRQKGGDKNYKNGWKQPIRQWHDKTTPNR